MASAANDTDLCGVALHKNHKWAAMKTYDVSASGINYTQVAMVAIPAQRHLFVDRSFKEETHLADGGDLINRFDVICRFCLNENDYLVDIFSSNDCVVMATESFVDVKIEADDMLPKRICTNCYKLLNQCIAFKQQVASTDTTLRQYIDQLKRVQIENKNDKFEATNPGITEQHIFDVISTCNELSDGHKFEDLTEEEYISGDDPVCQKNSNMYSDHEEPPVEDDNDPIDYSSQGKNEPITSPSHIVEHPPNVKQKSRKSAKCEQCGKEFSCHSILQRHIKSHSMEKLKYQCSVCSKSFSRLAGLKGHMFSHVSPNEGEEEVSQTFKCAKCNESFKEERDLYIHGSIHPEDSKIRCRQCVQDFSSLTKLRRHVKTHYGDKSIKCEQCGRTFTEIGSLTRHYRVHAKEFRVQKHVCKECGKAEKPWMCTKCDKRFTDLRLLKRHMRRHANVRNFCCTVCQKRFADRSKLTNHMRLHTGEKPFICNVCSKSFRLKWNLMDHLRVHSGEKPYKCSHCSKSFGASSTLAVHVRTHTGEKPYKCCQCSKQFASSSRLASHVRTHSNEKPYKCLHCLKSFGRSSTLAIHVRTHTVEMSYKCPHCSRTFGSSLKLAMHVSTHTASTLADDVRTHIAENSYKCPHCAKIFGRFTKLAVHVRSHTDEKLYKCPHCSETFGTSSKLFIHVRLHTGNQPS